MRDAIEALEPGRSAILKKGRLKRRVYEVKGPNHIWHCDGNDKLKPFGFGIHGCIDGFSRKIIWLTVGTTNKDPRIVLKLYLNSVEKSSLVPSILRMDKGTENFMTGDVQRLFRSVHTDDLTAASTMYGSSTHNQRIEQFWGSLRKAVLDVYIDLFKDLEMSGILDKSDSYEMNSLVFCFMDILKADLQRYMISWNAHRVRKNKQSNMPAGVPNFLYNYPEHYGFCQMGKSLNQLYLSECRNIYGERVDDTTFTEWALTMMLEMDWSLPKNRLEALDLFGKFLCIPQRP